MKRFLLRSVCIACIAVVAAVRTASAQSPVLWQGPDLGDWSVGANWSTTFVPLSTVGEFAVVNNGTAASVGSAVADTPGGVVLGEAAADSGTLRVENGGTLTVVANQDLGLTGAVTVGSAGTGTLIVTRGGTLNAVTLQSGGNAASSIHLGGGASGTAAINISGNTTLARPTRILGPGVAFTTDSLNLSGTLTTEISDAGYSTILVNDYVNLGGVLNLEFTDGFAPGPDETFDLIDAGMISGDFSAINANVSPGAGLVYRLQTVAGGTNGMLARIGTDVQLQLQVDRRTGAARIQNLAEERAVSMNAYGVTSAGGLLDESQWTPFSEGGPWSGNGSATHVTELSYSGSREIGPGAEISLGHIYSFTPTGLGEMGEDLAFQYHVAGGDVVNGAIDYSGAHNNLVLVVDEENGVFLQNQSIQDLSINAYAILSESGGLDPDEWVSLVDGGNADWTEANAAPNHITELNRAGALFLEAEGEAIPLGRIHSPGAMQDLQFLFNIVGEGPIAGVVEYDDGVIEFMSTLLEGDFNDSGLVEQGDLDLVLGNWGADAGDVPGTWVNDPPEGIVDQAELDKVLGNWGSTGPGLAAAAAVPEPHTLSLTLLVMLTLLTQRPVRLKRHG